MKVLFCVLLTACSVFLASCVTKNNERSIDELSNHMIKETGGTFLCLMEPGPVHAESGFSIMLADRQVAFYKFNTKRQKMVKHLERIRKKKCLYIVGIKYTAEVHGSFVMIDYDTNKKKDLLLKAFHSF